MGRVARGGGCKEALQQSGKAGVGGGLKKAQRLTPAPRRFRCSLSRQVHCDFKPLMA